MRTRRLKALFICTLLLGSCRTVAGHGRCPSSPWCFQSPDILDMHMLVTTVTSIAPQLSCSSLHLVGAQQLGVVSTELQQVEGPMCGRATVAVPCGKTFCHKAH